MYVYGFVFQLIVFRPHSLGFSYFGLSMTNQLWSCSATSDMAGGLPFKVSSFVNVNSHLPRMDFDFLL